jgi:hypothetical protein
MNLYREQKVKITASPLPSDVAESKSLSLSPSVLIHIGVIVKSTTMGNKPAGGSHL